MLHAARELLIDLERHELTLDDQEAAEQLPNPDSPSVVAPHSEQREHREQLLSQLDRLKETVVQEQTSNRMLRSEKSKLSGDMRHLAQELRQERAASNAVLAVRMGTEAPADGGAKAEAAHGELGSGTGGLTLASAASQILMLRREVKWLQKQWQSARRDQDGSANREQLDSLQQALETAQAEAAAAAGAAAAGAAQKRLLVRQLGSLRAQWAQQQKRLTRRTAAQGEASSLRVQLQAVHEALAAKQQQCRMAMEQLREIREMRSAEGATAGAREAAAAHAASRAAQLIAHRVMSGELGAAEQQAAQQAAQLMALVGAKSDLTLRLAQADEDRAGLTVELSTLKERAAQSDERLAALAVGGSGLPPPPSAPTLTFAPAPAPSAHGGDISISRGISFKPPKLGKLGKPSLDFKMPGRK